MLVWYGDAQRKRTNGRYWIDFAKKAIEESNYDYYIITDVRYDTYEKDELHFLKKEVNGIIYVISANIALLMAKSSLCNLPMSTKHIMTLKSKQRHIIPLSGKMKDD
jgi:hypothetical protein